MWLQRKKWSTAVYTRETYRLEIKIGCLTMRADYFQHNI